MLENSNTINKSIGLKIEELLNNNEKKQKDLAKHLSISSNIVSYWCNGTRKPNINQIVQISEYFNVSTDYLIGLSNTPTTDKDIQFICDYTGLTKESVEKLHHEKTLTPTENDEFTKEEQTQIIDSEFLILNKFISEGYLKKTSYFYNKYIECSEFEKSESKSKSKKVYKTKVEKSNWFLTVQKGENKGEKIFNEFHVESKHSVIVHLKELLKFNIQQLMTDLIDSCIIKSKKFKSKNVSSD